MRLEGKVVIVTGAGRNLGRVYAKGLAREGAKVAAADIIDASGTVEEIEAAGGEAMAVSVDVTGFYTSRTRISSSPEAEEFVGSEEGLQVLLEGRVQQIQ